MNFDEDYIDQDFERQVLRAKLETLNAPAIKELKELYPNSDIEVDDTNHIGMHILPNKLSGIHTIYIKDFFIDDSGSLKYKFVPKGNQVITEGNFDIINTKNYPKGYYYYQFERNLNLISIGFKTSLLELCQTRIINNPALREIYIKQVYEGGNFFFKNNYCLQTLVIENPQNYPIDCLIFYDQILQNLSLPNCKYNKVEFRNCKVNMKNFISDAGIKRMVLKNTIFDLHQFLDIVRNKTIKEIECGIMEVYSSWVLYTKITETLSSPQQRIQILPYSRRTELSNIEPSITYFDWQVDESCFIHLNSNSIVFL